MASISKRVSGSWVNGDYGIMKTATDTLTTLPAVIYPTGITATAGLKGQTVQSTTPTPDNPIMPQGCGEMTGNLINSDIYYGSYKQSDGTYQTTRGNLYNAKIKPFTLDDIGKTFTVSANISPTTGSTRLSANINGTVVNGSFAEKSVLTFTVETINDSIFFNYGSGTTTITTLSQVMLVEGSTPLPYEPYGIKTPVSSSGNNLFDWNWLVDGKGIFLNGSVVDDTNRTTTVDAIPVTANSYTLNYMPSDVNFISATYDNGVLINRVVHNSVPDIIDTTGANELRVTLFKTGVQVKKSDISNIMLNLGSTPLPYEPYNRTTTPIYLGETQTTRKIKKLVFDGTEGWEMGSENFYMSLSSNGIAYSYAYCSHTEYGKSLVNNNGTVL